MSCGRQCEDGEPDGVGGRYELLAIGFFGEIENRGLSEGIVGVGAQEHEANRDRGWFGGGGGREGDFNFAGFFRDGALLEVTPAGRSAARATRGI